MLKDAAIAEARARQQAEQERLLAEEAIAEANRNLALKQAGIQAEIDAAKAKSAAAGPLAQAERDQAILSEQQKVAERNAELKQRQLDTEVRKPADAARYKVEQEAEANRNAAVLNADAQRQATIAAAQAAAEQARLTGEGERARRAALAEANAIEGAKEGEAEQRRRSAIAEAVEREGQAEAAAILAKGQAEADAMARKAEAFAAYGEAAVLDLLVKVLPEVVGAASAPIGAIDKMTVISTDGASSLTKSVAGERRPGSPARQRPHRHRPGRAAGAAGQQRAEQRQEHGGRQHRQRVTNDGARRISPRGAGGRRFGVAGQSAVKTNFSPVLRPRVSLSQSMTRLAMSWLPPVAPAVTALPLAFARR